jgi:putative hydrolase of the HAD superfamily
VEENMFFDAVLFDLDDTLQDRKKAVRNFIDLFYQEYSSAIGEVKVETIKAIIAELDNRGYRSRYEVFGELLDRTPWKYRPDVDDVVKFWMREFPYCAEPMDHLYDVLDYFAAKGIDMGIVTNGGIDFQNKKIDKLGLRKYMKTIIISGEVGISKPDPRIFDIALEQMGSSRDRTLFVGDYAPNDIKGAVNAGLISVWISLGDVWSEKEYKPQYTIERLTDLMRFE